MLIEITEKCEASVFKRRRAVVVLALKARDEVIDELRDGGVLQTTMKQGGTRMPAFSQRSIRFLVMTVECFESRLQLRWQAQRIKCLAFGPALSSASLSECVPRDCGTWASLPRGYCRPREREAV